MKVWAIGDLHLPGKEGKTMDVFGGAWEGHVEKIAQRWKACVAAEDVVLIAGDISWAMRLEEAKEDLHFISSLPARYKIMVRGNHDYWWETLGKLRRNSPPDLIYLHNNAFSASPFVFAGTRGWELPSPEVTPQENAERERLCQRELGRLERSLKEASTFKGRLIVLLHFPPCSPDLPSTPFTEILRHYRPEAVVYAHLHKVTSREVIQGEISGIKYFFVSCDFVDFKPVLIAEA